MKKDLGGIYFVTASESVNQCEFNPIPISKTSNNFVAPYEGKLTPRDDSCEQVPQEKRNKVNIAAIRDRSYPIIRSIYLVLRTDDPDAKAWGEFYLKALRTEEGQSLISEAGFVPRANASN